jgi:hypothetical protein
MENVDMKVDVSRAWETVRENLNICALGHYELKKHKQWFNEGCSKLSAQRKQAKMQWLQDPSEINVDNLNNTTSHARLEASWYFRVKGNNI